MAGRGDGGGRVVGAALPLPRAAVDTKWQSDHLWLYLLALGFHPKRYRGVKLGRDMFAKPNSEAFSVVARFLFTKLDKHRARQIFKLPGFDKLSSFRLRKLFCLWLREISKKKGIRLPRITPSTLICPGGPRFVNMFYRFARFIMIKRIKKISVGTHIPFAAAVMWEPADMYIATARHRVAYNKLLQILQRKDFVVQEYREKAQNLIREIKRAESEYAVVQKQFWRMKQNDQNKNDTTERIQKVRSLWTLTVEMLASLQKEKEVVDSVLEDCVNPCILDGTDVVLHVPALLTYRVESNIYGFCTGNLYEDGKLNFLTVIQLLNEALMTLRDEHCPCELKESHRIEDMVTSYKNVLQKLNTKGLGRKQEHCEPNCQSISRKEEIWESKWKMILGQCPFNLIFKDDLHASSLQSFSSSDEDEDNVLFQSFSDNDSHHEEFHGKNDEALETTKDTLVPSGCDFIQHGDLSSSEDTDSQFLSSCLRRSSVPLSSEASENRDLVIENNFHTCVGNKKPVPPKILKNGKEEFPTSEMEENAGENVTQPKSPVKNDDFLEKASDELAEEIAKSVMSETPNSDEEKEMALDDLISSLFFDPFLTRKQLLRTPENLRTEIRSSWRKDIQTEDSIDKESSMNATPSMQEEVDSSEPASLVSDLGPPVSEKKSQLSSTESSSQEEVSVRYTFESSASKTSGIQESERTESEELDCSTLSGSSVKDLSQTLQNAEKCMNIPDICLKSHRTNTLSSDRCHGFLMDEMPRWNLSALNSICRETTDMGILDETLPEYEDTDLSTSVSLDSESLIDDSENNDDIEKLDLHTQSLSSSHEALKRPASKSGEKLHQTHNRDKFGSYRAELSMILEKGKENDDRDPSMDKEFPKMPLPNSPNESKENESNSLSSLLVFCQQMNDT